MKTAFQAAIDRTQPQEPPAYRKLHRGDGSASPAQIREDIVRHGGPPVPEQLKDEFGTGLDNAKIEPLRDELAEVEAKAAQLRAQVAEREARGDRFLILLAEVAFRARREADVRAFASIEMDPEIVKRACALRVDGSPTWGQQIQQLMVDEWLIRSAKLLLPDCERDTAKALEAMRGINADGLLDLAVLLRHAAELRPVQAPHLPPLERLIEVASDKLASVKPANN